MLTVYINNVISISVLKETKQMENLAGNPNCNAKIER